ncbi:MAG: DUF3086 domain-containing protein [Potamolinea sp.]
MNSDESQTTDQKPEQQPAPEESAVIEQEPATTADVSDNLDNLDQPKPTYELTLLPLPDDYEDSVEKLKELEQETALFELMQPRDDKQEAVEELAQTVADLERQERDLRQKIAVLQETQSQILTEHLAQTQAAVERMVQEGLSELEQRKQALQISVEQLERRRERIRAEMRTSFAGVSQELAIRVQGFKDYLVGSLQDLASAAEQLELSPPQEPPKPVVEESRSPEKTQAPKLAEQGFQEQARQIRKILDQYRTLPDYYGPPWQLRRTFEPIHAERVSNWFFTQGGRGAIKTMGSRLQNILVASATISVMRSLYGDRLRTLIIANSPERLGEWRRGLQDCLGISRSDFGPERGLVLFEEAPALVQKADRLLTQKQLPLIIVDETEDQISLSMLQFPLWLAFAPDPQQMSTYDY